MQFDSFSAFLDMGGYGFFVWLSYGAALLLFAILLWASIAGHTQTKRSLLAKLKRDKKLLQRAQKQVQEQPNELAQEPSQEPSQKPSTGASQ